ncbi:MAG: Holliday junction branch migration protein RuvA [Alphaproteobacteria bacterium]|jgi:Holliday junction DNA helicase RuvA|nr:Holliday junction branch migration protein RuvA [Candidatus Jidaibacter sp.]
MIGKLTGKLDYIGSDYILLDVMGVGYKAFVSSDVLVTKSIGSVLSLFIEMIVREDQISLYGFESMHEKEWFNLLQSVQGIGAKMALNILSSMPISSIQMAILSGDDKAFKQISGIGAKIAQRIVIELKNNKEIAGVVTMVQSQAAGSGVVYKSNTSDAIDALVGLGFARTDAFKVVTEMNGENDNIEIEELIKNSLLKLSSLT